MTQTSVQAEARKHDGFLFRFMGGYALGNIKDNNNPTSTVSLTGGYPLFLDFGGAINDYVGLHAGLRYFSSKVKRDDIVLNTVYNTEDETYNYSARGVFNLSATETVLNFGASFYIPSAMVFFRPEFTLEATRAVQGELIVTANATGRSSGSSATITSSTPLVSGYKGGVFSGYGLTIGKEWWTGDEWALGLALFYQISNYKFVTSNIPSSDGQTESKDTQTTYGLLFSATYN